MQVQAAGMHREQPQYRVCHHSAKVAVEPRCTASVTPPFDMALVVPEYTGLSCTKSENPRFFSETGSGLKGHAKNGVHGSRGVCLRCDSRCVTCVML